MQDLNDMLYFVEVVERGGFAAAGRALGIPKSRLSRRIAELESQLGVRLLQRTTRKLSLTEVGAAYLRHCQAMRDAAQAAQDTVEQVQSEPRGTVRVTCPVTLSQTVLAPLIPRFLAQYPLVRLEMQVVNRPVNVGEEGVTSPCGCAPRWKTAPHWWSKSWMSRTRCSWPALTICATMARLSIRSNCWSTRCCPCRLSKVWPTGACAATPGRKCRYSRLCAIWPMT